MSLSLSLGSYLTNTASPISAYPWTIGFWVWPNDTGGDAVCLRNSGSSQYHEIQSDGTSWLWIAQAGAGENTATATNAFTNNNWQFVLARGISATNRRLSVLMPAGNVISAQNTTSTAPAVTIFNIGEFSTGAVPLECMVAEFWYTNADVQADAAATQDWLIRKLAFDGPFSVAQAANSIIEYRSFRVAPFYEDVNEYCLGAGKSRQTWAVGTGTVATGMHRPLSSSYEKPGQNKRVLAI